MNNCPNCGGPMAVLFSSEVCAQECDLKQSHEDHQHRESPSGNAECSKIHHRSGETPPWATRVLREEATSLRDENARLRDENTSLRESEKRAWNQVFELEDELVNLRKRYAELEEAADLNALLALKEQNAALLREVTRLREENTRLRDDIYALVTAGQELHELIHSDFELDDRGSSSLTTYQSFVNALEGRHTRTPEC